MLHADPRGIFVRVKPGNGWSDLDDVLQGLPGANRLTLDARGMSLGRPLVQLPEGSMEMLRQVFAGRSDRLVIHAP